jgi:PGF-pre-PGF domain-containing protein
VPSGAYDIKLDGDAAEGASSVSLTITASSKITADTQGNFEDKYSTSGVPPGNFTLNIGGITRTITLTTPGDKSESAAKSTSSSSSGGGVSSSGGGGASGENFKNIELKEIYDQEIFRDKIISYGFKNKSNPILFVNITSNVSAGEITTSVEVLRNTSSLVKSPASGEVYKNINIWMGTSDFAIPKNIREATISFRVENSWLDNNNLASNVMKMLKWDGSKWMELDTTEKTKGASYTYYEAKTDTFSSFAISGLKNETLPAATSTAVPGINAKEPVITSLTPTTTIATATSTPVKVPGFEAIILITALLVWRLRKI